MAAIGTVIAGSGGQFVTGGTVTGTRIASGFQQIGSKGTATSTTLDIAARQDIVAGGVAISTTMIGGQNLQNVFSGIASLTTIREAFGQHPLKLLGFADDDPAQANMRVSGYPVLGDYRHLVSLIQSGGLDCIRRGLADPTTIFSGGTEIVSGRDIGASISGGTQDVFGAATGATVSGGVEIIETGGTASGTTIKAGGLAIVESGACSAARRQ